MKNTLPIIALLLMFFLSSLPANAQTAKQLAAAWEKNHISAFPPSEVRLTELKTYLEKLKKLGLKVAEVGRSFENREIYQIEWGRGKTKVFLWSQMHGNEPTATSALVDMFAFLQKNRAVKWVRELENKLTIRAVPMLNPDGAEVYKRANAQGLDINRDALALATPEGRLLKKLRDEFQPEIGFNLHNQRELTTVGATTEQATISLLAVGADPKLEPLPGQARNRRLCVLMFRALSEFIKGRIGRYDDEYTPTAFGDNFSNWGTPVILIETGGHHGEPQAFVIKLNFVAYLTALNALVSGTEKEADAAIYETIPFNSGGRLYDVIFRNAEILKPVEKEPVKSTAEADGSGEDEPGVPEKTPEPEPPAEFAAPFKAEVAVNTERRRTGQISFAAIARIGDLTDSRGLREFDVSDHYLVPDAGRKILFYKKTRRINWKDPEFINKNTPDGIFSNGVWTKPLKRAAPPSRP